MKSGGSSTVPGVALSGGVPVNPILPGRGRHRMMLAAANRTTAARAGVADISGATTGDGAKSNSMVIKNPLKNRPTKPPRVYIPAKRDAGLRALA